MKQLLITSLLFVSAMSAGAEVLTPQQALDRINTSASNLQHKAPSAIRNTMELRATMMTPDKSSPAIYLFTNQRPMDMPVAARPGLQGGKSVSLNDISTLYFVSADDLAEPILGFVDIPAVMSESVSIEQMPPQLQWWLGEYAAQIEAANNVNRSKQASYSTNEGTMPERIIHDPVWPLVSTHWNQDSPFNSKCPKIDTRACYVGCVPTAFGQIMKYHNYPEVGQGSITYTPNSGSTSSTKYKEELSMDFTEVTFDWGNMVDNYLSNYTDEQADAVATLMQALSYASQVDFGIGSTSAYPSRALVALINNFNYNYAAKFVYQSDYPLSVYSDIVYDNLCNVGPLPYSGRSHDNYGHSFVCDGYWDGYFHFNWGWSGHYDGYFLLTAINPAGEGIGGNGYGEYTFSQYCGINITKPDNPTISLPQLGIYTKGNFYIEVKSNTSITMRTDKYALFMNGSPDPVDVFIAAKLEGEDGVYYIPYSTTASHVSYGNTSLNITLPSTLPAGTYKTSLVYRYADEPVESYRHPVLYMGGNRYDYLTKDEDGNLTAENLPAPEIEVTDITVNTSLRHNNAVSISYTLTNNSEGEMWEGYYPVIYTKNSAEESDSGIQLLDEDSDVNIIDTGDVAFHNLMPGQTIQKTQDTKFKIPEIPNSQVYMALKSSTTNKLFAETPVTVDETPAENKPRLTCESIVFNGNPEDAVASDLSFTVTVKCTGGDYANTIFLQLETDNHNSSINQLLSPTIYVNNGQTATVDIKGGIPTLEIGKTYSVIPFAKTSSYSSSSMGGARTSIVLGHITSGIEDIVAGEDGIRFDRSNMVVSVADHHKINSIEVYSVDGHKVSASGSNEVSLSPLPGGLYIVKVTLGSGQTLLRKIVR